MEYLIVALAALVASALTLFSGFGLGTLLLPVFAIFFPVDLAVAATAVVHGANNVLKASLLGRLADGRVVLRFGLPAIAAALAGAWILGLFSELEPLARYSLLGRTAIVTPLKLLMASLMIGFAVLELHPRFATLEIDRKYLPAGGLLSGFFGGLSGHQGALRSAFLAKVGISAQSFVGTNAIIGLLVDLTRLSMYGALLAGGRLSGLTSFEGRLVLTGILAAFIGVFAGKRFVGKITMKLVQRLTGGLLLLIGLLLGTGLL